MEVEIENDGRKCTKFKIDGQDMGTGISALDIHIEACEKPTMIITTHIKKLKINGKDIDIYKRKNKKQFFLRREK